ncbi:anosmin-1 [Clonorchis sinensis]|uniref:Anosmin-1 n=1 Tax=Clonorchis sinensis TaxID=79923 RepID=G7Y634_CLOSI|nr:anosmin-1 [Clonorchis sinensis]
MTFTNNSNFMPHRPSRGAISRVALLAAYSRAGVRKTRTPRLAIEKLVDPEVKRNYQNQLVECLPDGTVSDINGHWEKISKALLKVGTSVCGTTQPTSFKHWISDRTVSLLETRRQIPPGRHHNSTRRIIRRQVKLSVRADREAWWTRKAQEMEDAKNAGNTGDSPGGWSCLTGCRVLDAALKERSGECPPQGGPAIHRLPGLMEQTGEWQPPKSQAANKDLAADEPSGKWYPSVHSLMNDAVASSCTVDAECPNKKDKCCHSKCKRAVFREDILPLIPTVRILESKSPPSFVLSWDSLDSDTVRANLSNPTVYVLQVKTYFGPEFDSRLSNAWKTLVMSTLTGAQLSEPRIGWWYQFQVASVNRWGSLGFEIPSPPVQLTSQKPQAPSAPRELRDGMLSLQADKEIRVQIHWSPPAVASIPVTEYRIYWGPDSPHTPEESDFSEKPTQFVQTVPASETSYVLTNLASNALYRVQVLAMSEWGTVQLRSRPSIIFVRTPSVDHLGVEQRPLDMQIFSTQDITVDTDETSYPQPDGSRRLGGSFSARVHSAMDLSGGHTQCICDGKSKSGVLPEPSVISTATPADSPQLTAPPRFELHTDPAVFDGRQVRMRLQLSEHSSNRLGLDLVHLKWTAQVCIETHGAAEPRLTPLATKPQPISTNKLVGTKPVEQLLLQPSTLALHLKPMSKNQTVIRYGEAELTNLQLNCRYILEVLRVPSTSGGRKSSEPDMLLRACVCTPACSELVLSPWVPTLDCQRSETVNIPTPRNLKYHLVKSAPLVYNITWLPGREMDETRPKHDTFIRAEQMVSEKLRSVNFDTKHNLMHYRVIWGPSRDKPISPNLWKLWPGLHPRLDPANSEAKVLRKGETSLLISPLSAGTQYIVKVQAINPTSVVSATIDDEAFATRHLTDPGRVVMRSTSPGSQVSLPMVSKEAVLYFETPTTTHSGVSPPDLRTVPAKSDRLSGKATSGE